MVAKIEDFGETDGWDVTYIGDTATQGAASTIMLGRVEKPSGLRGDVDSDSKVTMRDALRVVVGLEE